MQHQQDSRLLREGNALNTLPQYMTTDRHRSTGSNGSQESIMTQLPLPFHSPLPSDTDVQQGGASSHFGSNRPWNSSELEVPKSGASQLFSSKSLNPNSSAYVPRSRAQAAVNDQDFQILKYQNDIKTDGHADGFSSLYKQQVQAQIGHPPYPNPNLYRAEGGNSSHLQSQYGLVQSLHGNFGNEDAGNGHNYNGNGFDVGNLGFQAPNYAMANNHNPQISPYSPGCATSAAQNKGWVQACNSSNFSSGSRPNNSQYRPNPTALSFEYRSGVNSGGNIHRINEHNIEFVNNSGSQYSNTSQSTNQYSSNKSIVPVGMNSAQNSRPASALKVANSLPPPMRPSSAATYTSSSEMERPLGNDIEGRPDIPTPGPKPHALEIQFSSEPRNNTTPTLRSRRGQSISTISTDPPRKNAMTNWLDNVPSLAGNALGDLAERLRSPPKMMRFNDGGNSMLGPVHEGDPFSDSSLQPANFSNLSASTTATGSVKAGNILRNAGNGMSPQYRSLTNGGTRNPSIQEALDPQNLPFVEYCRNASPSQWGVIRIKNIPYSVNRPEVLAFLGRNARIIAEAKHEPVHIVMERVTSKTLNCYVEFVNFQEAINAVNRFETNRTGGRGGRLGPRHVEVELSSQDQLMNELFPKAKNVIWRNGPQIIPRDPNDLYNSGFQGFVSKEELVMLVKHVEAPQRSPFSKDCPQRPFECLISTLLKYPWQMVDYITIQDRNLIHQATKDLLSLLVERVFHEKNDIHLNPTLLKRVWRAAMLCPGFTPSMKDDIVVICDIGAQTAIELGLAPLAAEWRFLWTIGPRPDVPVDVLMYYIDLISNATSEQKPRLSLAEQAAQGFQNSAQKLFGDLDKFIQYPKGLGSRTLAEVAHAEWTAIEHALRRALTPAIENQ